MSNMTLQLRLKARDDGLKATIDGAKSSVDGLSREFTELESKIDPTTSTMREFKEAQGIARREFESGRISLEKYNKTLSLVDQAYGRTANGGIKNLGYKVGQLSYQLQDSAVQFQNNTDASIILAQQGSQVASIFGPGGAVIGALLAVGSVVGGTLFSSMMSSADATDVLETSLESLKAIITETKDGTILLTDEIMELAVQSRSAAELEITRGLLLAGDALNSSKDQLNETLDDTLGGLMYDFDTVVDHVNYQSDIMKRSLTRALQVGDISGDAVAGVQVIRGQLEDLQNDYGLTEKQAISFVESVSQTVDEPTIENLKGLQETISGLGIATKDTSPEFTKLSAQLVQNVRTIIESTERTTELETALSSLDETLKSNGTEESRKRREQEIETTARFIASLNEESALLHIQATDKENAIKKSLEYKASLFNLDDAQKSIVQTLIEQITLDKERIALQQSEIKNNTTVVALEDELKLLQKTARERAINTATRKLDANATVPQILLAAQLAGQIYDVTEAKKAEAEADKERIKQLNDANTAAQRFLQDGKLGEIEGLESIQDQLRDAMSVKGITADMEADFAEAIDKIQDRIGDLKFNNMIDGMTAGIAALQGLTEEGTDSYKTMQIAMAGFNVVQGISAVLKQLSEGDPYTAFARAGAALAAVAALGVAINGGGGLDVSAQRQASQGAGGVLGDASAKSESILKSNEIIADATETIVGINRGMLDALLSLEVSINGAALQITRKWDDTVSTPGITSLGGPVSITAAVWSKILDPIGQLGLDKLIAEWGGASVKGKDSGLVLDGSLSNISAQSYTSWKERKNWLDDYDEKWQFSELDPQITQQLRLVMGGIADSVSAGADQLGLSGDAIDQAIKSFALERTLISLKGLTGDEQQEELQAVFSSIFDDLSVHVMPWLVEFQQAGEGLGETLSRLATEASAVDNVVSMLGLTFGTVDDQLRAKTNLVSAMGGLEEFVSAYSSFSDKFLSEEQQFANARDQLQSAFAQYDAILPASREDYLALVQAQDAATEAGAKQIAKLFELSTAADEYYSALEDREKERAAALQQYQSIYYSEAEQTEQLRKQLTGSFADLNLQMPATLEQFRALTESMDTTTIAGQDAYDSLLDLAPEFANLNSIMNSAADSADNLANRVENALNPKTDQQVQTAALGTLGFGGLSIEQAMAQLNALGSAGLESLKNQLSISDSMFEETIGTIISAYNDLQNTNAIEASTAAREQESAVIARNNAALEIRNQALAEEQSRLDALAGIDEGFGRLGLTFEEVMTQAIGDMIENVKDKLAEVGGTDGLLDSGVNAQLIDLIDTRSAINSASSYQSMIEQVQSGVRLANLQTERRDAVSDLSDRRYDLNYAVSFLSRQDNAATFDTSRITSTTNDALIPAIHSIQDWMRQNATSEMPNISEFLGTFERRIENIDSTIDSVQSGETLARYRARLEAVLSDAGVDSISGLQLHDADLVSQIREIEDSFGGLVRFLDDNGNVLSDIANELSLSQDELNQLSETFRNDFQDAFAAAMNIDLDAVGDTFNNVAVKWADVIYSQEEQLGIQLSGLRDKLGAFDELGLSSATTVEQFKALFEAAQKTASGAELGTWWAAADVVADINATLNDLSNLDPNDISNNMTSAVDSAFAMLNDAIDAELESLSDAWTDRRDALKDEIATLKESASTVSSFVDALSNTADSLNPTNLERYTESQKALFDWVDDVQSNGWSNLSDYDDFLSDLGSINANWYATSADYERDRKLTNLALAEAQSLASGQLSVEDQTLETLNNTLELEQAAYDNSVATLEAQREFWQSEMDVLNNVDTTLLDLNAAISQLTSVIDDVYIERGEAAPGLSFVANGSHANGLDSVPFDGYIAQLHKGEMVLPAGQSDYLRSGETAKQFKALADEVAALRKDNKALLQKISTNTANNTRMTKSLKNGLPVYMVNNNDDSNQTNVS